jgi:hypothetical protein
LPGGWAVATLRHRRCSQDQKCKSRAFAAAAGLACTKNRSNLLTNSGARQIVRRVKRGPSPRTGPLPLNGTVVRATKTCFASPHSGNSPRNIFPDFWNFLRSAGGSLPKPPGLRPGPGHPERKGRPAIIASRIAPLVEGCGRLNSLRRRQIVSMVYRGFRNPSKHGPKGELERQWCRRASCPERAFLRCCTANSPDPLGRDHWGF